MFAKTRPQHVENWLCSGNIGLNQIFPERVWKFAGHQICLLLGQFWSNLANSFSTWSGDYRDNLKYHNKGIQNSKMNINAQDAPFFSTLKSVNHVKGKALEMLVNFKYIVFTLR